MGGVVAVPASSPLGSVSIVPQFHSEWSARRGLKRGSRPANQESEKLFRLLLYLKCLVGGMNLCTYVRRLSSSRMRQEVCHDSICSVRLGGKSDPLSTIQETVLDNGGGENKRAPKAEKDPAPPSMSKTGGVGGR